MQGGVTGVKKNNEKEKRKKIPKKEKKVEKKVEMSRCEESRQGEDQ
jgi:hypothetical protein